MNLILMGYRGSGKSSVGKRLADELWKDFVDLDDVVRERFDGRAIADIWQAEGESAFRAVEAEEAAQLLDSRKGLCLALGGGTLVTSAGREAIASAADARRIYLSCDPKVLAERISSDASTTGQRPSLTGDADPSAEVERVLVERDPVYREVADIVFDVTYCSIDEVVRHLIAKL